MSVRAAIGRQSGIHQSQAVQKFRPGSKCTADPRNARTLVEPSAYKTPSASEDFPDPDTPAIPTI